LSIFNEQGISVPVILGGAALTPRFVHGDCREAYQGQVVYGRDAFADLRFMDALMDAKNRDRWDDQKGFLDGPPDGLGIALGLKEGAAAASAPEDAEPLPAGNGAHGVSAAVQPATASSPEAIVASLERSAEVPAQPALQPPFWGSRILDEHQIPLAEVAAYLDRNALFAGQWQLQRGANQSREAYQAMLQDKAEPVLAELLKQISEEALLTPRVAYGYFPCGRQGNSVVVFDPQGLSDSAAPSEAGAVLGRFDLPRQRGGNRYCIADFYRDLEPRHGGELGPTDVLPLQSVTMGERASQHAQELFRSDRYSDYLYFHGLAVQMAEALAEWTHARIRKELGFADQEPDNLRAILAQRYRGSRYSFGYPACPEVADSRQLLAWLDAERIGLRMDDSDQLEPEQSTTALVALHSKARYFSA
jgi:5-methyltetrahydrofolate--homocysteine methyltransferase